MSDRRRHATGILTSSGRDAPLALTAEQARILHDLVMLNGKLIMARWSPGMWYGLLDALRWVEDAGGAYVNSKPPP